MVRATVSIAMVCEKAQASEAAVKSASPARYTRR